MLAAGACIAAPGAGAMFPVGSCPEPRSAPGSPGGLNIRYRGQA